LTEVLSVIEQLSWENVTVEKNVDRGRLWFDLLLASSSGSQAKNRLRSLLDGSVSLPAVQISEDLRWEIVITLSSLGASDIGELLSAERERDNSDQGQKYAIAADAAQPDASVKQHWLKQIVDPESGMGLAKQRYAIATLFPANQTSLQAEQLQQVLSSLPLFSDRDPYFVSSYVSGLLRPVCTSESVAAMASALEEGGLNSTAELFLREAHQADEECLNLKVGMSR